MMITCIRSVSGVAWPQPHKTRKVCMPSKTTSNVRQRRVAIRANANGINDILVSDFDGVLLDSEPELSASGIHAATTIWADVLGGEHPNMEQLVHDIRDCRSKLVNGFEAVIMARLLIQHGKQGKDAILGDHPPWEQLWPGLLEQWGMSPPELSARFDAQRTTQATQHPDQWMASQRIYPGIKSALQRCEFPVYFASSKAASRISLLLTQKFGLDVAPDSPRLYAELLPPNEKKLEALQYVDGTIQARPMCQHASLHFIDDRIETLHYMTKHADLVKSWRLYYASWGYSTPEERVLARELASQGVQWMELEDFVEFLRWGLVMGVNDGCQEADDDLYAGDVRGTS